MQGFKLLYLFRPNPTPIIRRIPRDYARRVQNQWIAPQRARVAHRVCANTKPNAAYNSWRGQVMYCARDGRTINRVALYKKNAF